MPFRSLLKKAWWRYGLIFAVWTMVGLFFAAQFYLASAQFGNPVTWQRALTSSLADWYVFALLSVPALWLGRRFPLDAPEFWRNLTLHLVGCTAFALLYMVLRAWLGTLELGGSITFAAIFNPMMVRTFHFNVLVYWVVVSLSGALRYYRKFRERELRAAELEKRLVEARLQALQMQLNPHFLFNTLNAIAALMHKDVEAADRVLVRLSELLRVALESSQTQEVTLGKECEFIRRYLEIEQIRFGSRLVVSLELAPETLEALVPNLILQPILENAIRHGIQPRAGQGRVVLSARRENGRLLLCVEDNGGGLSTSEPLREGIGLSNTRARLLHLYGEAQRLRFLPAAAGGLAVEIELPFHTAPLESGSPPI
jgi:two-component system, LytTR family, sensor kinase